MKSDEQLNAGDLFRTHHRAVWAIGYRMTGCAADADDIVQETFARAIQGRAAPGETSAAPSAAWLSRVAVNLSIDMLRRRRRQGYAGAWLPAPIEGEAGFGDAVELTPEARYSRRESVSFAFLLALEALSPRQRAVLLLRDVFDYSAREVGEILSMTEENVRVTHHRARRAMRSYDGERREPTGELRERTEKALTELLRCLLLQDMAGMEALLADGVRTITDAGGEFNALRVPMVGKKGVATLHMRVAKRRSATTELREINGLPGLVIQYARAERRQAPRAVLRCEVDGVGRISEIHVVMAVHKLSAIRFDTEL